MIVIDDGLAVVGQSPPVGAALPKGSDTEIREQVRDLMCTEGRCLMQRFLVQSLCNDFLLMNGLTLPAPASPAPATGAGMTPTPTSKN